MEIAYDNNEAKRIYQEVKSVRKGFQPQTLLIRDKVGDTVSNKEKVLQMWSDYYNKHFKLLDGTSFFTEETISTHSRKNKIL